MTVSNRKAGPGPGGKGQPLQPIVERWSQGGYLWAKLGCGHVIRITKTFSWEQGVLVPCGECPGKKKRRRDK